MIAVIQRVEEAFVKVEDSLVGSCANGLLILLGVSCDDSLCNFF